MLNRFLFTFVFFSTCYNFVGAQSFLMLFFQKITKKQSFIYQNIYLADVVEDTDNYSPSFFHQANFAATNFLSNVMNSQQQVSRNEPWLLIFQKFVEMIFAKESETSLYMQANALSCAENIPRFVVEWVNQFVNDQLIFPSEQIDPSKTILAPEVQPILSTKTTQLPKKDKKQSSTKRSSVNKKGLSKKRVSSTFLEQQECSICLEAHKEVVSCPAGQCSALFGKRCLNEWLEINNSCPGCRGVKKE